MRPRAMVQATGLLAAALLPGCVMNQPAQAQPRAQQNATFDVVSVKPSPPDARLSETTYDAGSLIAHGVNLKQLIEWAYQVTDVQVSGGPAWQDSKFFDVEAKAAGAHTKDELLRMLQPVLADRFKLALHRETKQMAVQILAAGGHSSELHPAQGGPANVRMQFVPQEVSSDITIEVIGQSASARYLADYLTGVFGTLVVDRTGLAGRFDFKVDIAVNQDQVIANKRAAMMGVLTDAMPRLGFKLTSRKEAVEVLVIDQAEPPSAN